MGWIAQEFAGPDEELLEALQNAYADEWFAHYNYFVVAQTITGFTGATLSALLLKRSGAAFRRAERLVERIIQLGGEPIPKLGEIMDHATDKPFKLPKRMDDVEGLLKAVLDAERTSARTQQQLYERTKDSDPLTAVLAQSLLAESLRGEQQMEKLLGSPHPEMDGT